MVIMMNEAFRLKVFEEADWEAMQSLRSKKSLGLILLSIIIATS